jgi:UTP--glucose-1-phosphate uridylyltransferase
VVLEEFRLPADFDPDRVPVFATNTFHLDARALLTLNMEWTYFVVEKTVDGRAAVQLERLVNELTRALPTRYLRVPRTGAASRFLPVKDRDELERRQSEIEVVARARGMIS